MSRANQTVMIEAIRLLCRPLASFCIRRAIKIQELIEICKQTFSEEAVRYLESNHQEANVSKVAALTGMHRRDVMRLLNENAPEKVPVPLFRKVIGQWQQDKRFYSSPGRGRPLSYEGRESEFAELVQSVSQDLNPYTVLFELERIGALIKSGSSVKLVAEVYVPKGDVKRGFDLAARDIDDLLRAVEGNLLDAPEMPHLHVKTHYDNIVPEALPKIQEWFLTKGNELHEEARKFLSKFDKDLNPKLSQKPGGARVALGTFSLTETGKEETEQ